MSFRNTILNQRSGDPSRPRPLSNRHEFALEFQHMIISFVVALFFARRPSAVCRRIGSIILYSLDSVFICWGFAHIRQKVREGFSPASANGNAPSSVIFPRGMAWGVTPTEHTGPAIINRCMGHSMRFICAREFMLPAAATHLSCSSKIPAVDRTRISTITVATPIDDSLPSNKTLGDKPSKPVSGEVYKVRHRSIIHEYRNKVNTGAYNTVI